MLTNIPETRHSNLILLYVYYLVYKLSKESAGKHVHRIQVEQNFMPFQNSIFFG